MDIISIFYTNPSSMIWAPQKSSQMTPEVGSLIMKKNEMIIRFDEKTENTSGEGLLMIHIL